MDNRDDRNKISNEMEQCCDNKEKLKVDEQIKFQQKCTKRVKRQHFSWSITNYEHNEEARNFRRKSATHENQKGVSMVFFLHLPYLKMLVKAKLKMHK
jgi:hypothetical protein